MIVVAGVGVALSCFKVKVPFIIAIKHGRCGRNKRAGMPKERERRTTRSNKDRNKKLMV